MNDSNYSLKELISLFSQNDCLTVENTRKLALWALIVGVVLFGRRQRYVKHKKCESSHPLFVLGHWRSGTTSLQSSLVQSTGLTADMFFSTFGGVLEGRGNKARKILEFLCSPLGFRDPIHNRKFSWNMPTEEFHAIATSLH